MRRQFKIFLQLSVFTIAAGSFVAMSASAQDLMPVEEMPLDLPQDNNEIQMLLPDEAASSSAMPEGADLTPIISETAGTPNIPEAAQAEEFDENLFFDAEALVPDSELSSKGAPSKVNPVLSPGSRLVVTRKNANPGSKEARLVAADRAMKLGRFESALEIYNGIYASNKRDPNVLMGRAVALQRIGRDDEAIDAYEALLDIRSKNIDAQVNLQGLLGKRYPAVAMRNLLELHEDNPGNTAIVAQLSVVEAKMGRYGDAIRYLGMAASMEPENAGHVFNMAIIADRAGDKKQAIAFYEEALEIDTLYGSGRSIPRDSVFERLAELR